MSLEFTVFLSEWGLGFELCPGTIEVFAIGVDLCSGLDDGHSPDEFAEAWIMVGKMLLSPEGDIVCGAQVYDMPDIRVGIVAIGRRSPTRDDGGGGIETMDEDIVLNEVDSGKEAVCHGSELLEVRIGAIGGGELAAPVVGSRVADVERVAVSDGSGHDE